MDEKEIVLKLYQNVDMGIVGIDAIYSQIENKILKRKIKSQKKEYMTLKRKLAKMCKRYKVTDKDLKPFVKLTSELMVSMKTMLDKSDSKIAKLMMEGTNKGLIQIQELLNHYNKKDKKLVKCMKEILTLEHQNNNELKKYL